MIIFIKTLSSQITKNKVICRASIVFTVEYYFYIEATFMLKEFWYGQRLVVTVLLGTTQMLNSYSIVEFPKGPRTLLF